MGKFDKTRQDIVGRDKLLRDSPGDVFQIHDGAIGDISKQLNPLFTDGLQRAKNLTLDGAVECFTSGGNGFAAKH